MRRIAAALDRVRPVAPYIAAPPELDTAQPVARRIAAAGRRIAGSVAAATIQAAANATISCGAEATALSLTANTGVDLYAGTADFAAGDSTAVVYLQYSVIG